MLKELTRFKSNYFNSYIELTLIKTSQISVTVYMLENEIENYQNLKSITS